MLDRTGTRPLRACLVTGSPSAGRCGIHDYSLTLAGALERRGIEVQVLDQRDWSIAGTLKLARRISRIAPDVLQMQYPMIVGWRSLGPHAAGFLSRVPNVLTLHEFTTFDRLRRTSLWAFSVHASHIVLTTTFEAGRFLERFRMAKAKTTIIPIGSNVPFRDHAGEPRSRRTIIFFGQIKPLKGLEQFIELAGIAGAKNLPWSFQVMGAPVAWAKHYLADMRRKAADIPVEWLLNKDDDEAADLLYRADAAYLAYPDGVSERRGSLIAALGNGLPVVTTTGPFRTAELDDAVVYGADPGEACTWIERIFADADLERRLRGAGRNYVKRFDWQSIAERYEGLYRQVAAKVHVARVAA